MSKTLKGMDVAAARLAKAISVIPDLMKASHEHQDAMAHHARHAVAASAAGDDEAASKHKFMHLRHALEAVRHDPSHSMASKMHEHVGYHSRNASDEIHGMGSGSFASMVAKNDHPLVKHFKDKKGFVPHKHDSKFKEDYATSKPKK